jgi:cytochrome c biogenesis protein CcdA
MKILSIVGLVISVIGAGAGIYNMIEFVPKMTDEARDLFGSDLWFAYHEEMMMWGNIAMGAGLLGIILGVVGGIKKEKIGWIAVAIGLVSLFLGLSQATHMFD